MIVWRCDRCGAMADASTRTGAPPKNWTLGMGEDLCPKCSKPKGDA